MESKHLWINPKAAILVIVDIQEKFVAAMPETDLQEVVRNTKVMIAAARELNIPILLSQQYTRGLGPTLPELRAELQDVQAIEKMSFSCCAEPEFNRALGMLPARREVLLCGIETHICILQTALELMDQGYRVFIAADTTCSRAKRNHELALEMMRQRGAAIGSSEIFLFQLLRVSGTDAFKKLSRLIHANSR